MISFKTISSFRYRLTRLLKVKRNVYSGISEETKKEFYNKPINEIRQNNDMILISNELIVIKLRLPDKKLHISKRDGFRLIYLVSQVDDLVVFLDVYPKNGPLQQLDIDDKEVKRLIEEFITEGKAGILEEYVF